MNDISPFDSLASEYDRWFEEAGKTIFQIESRAFQQILPEFPRPWLEVGIGSGRFARALGVDYGLDPARNILRLARDRGIKVVQGRGEELPLGSGRLGTVFLIVTLCFVERTLAVLNEIHRILSPTGCLVLGLVLRESPWGKFYLRKSAQGHRFYQHANFFSFPEVEGLLRQAGFGPARVISTLFQEPGEVRALETARKGYFPDAGFTIISAPRE